MSFINNEELKKITNGSSINMQTIDFAKNVLILQLKPYIFDETQAKIIKEKIDNMKIEILSNDDFKDKYYKSNGKGFLPGAYVYQNTIYFRNDLDFDINELHNLIHEMLHIISDNGEKMGLLQHNKEKNYMYGRGLDEAFTEYLTSLILDVNFQGYSKDFEYIIQLLMILTNLDIKDLFKLYISNEEWLTDEIISRFNSNDNELVGLVVEYDNKLNPNKTFNPNNVFYYLFNSIKCKINNNEKFDVNKLQELLKQYYNYYYDVDRELDLSVRTSMAEILDILGTYKYNISR